jgi:hypothetical protein
MILDSFRVECDDCHKTLMGAFDTLRDAQAGAQRAGWLCEPLGGDVLCPLCRRSGTSQVLPEVAA